METINYKGIKIKLVFDDYEFQGYFDNELIKGYTSSKERAKKIIDETINFITQYQERNRTDKYPISNQMKMNNRDEFCDYE
jgi:hypothetical protein